MPRDAGPLMTAIVDLAPVPDGVDGSSHGVIVHIDGFGNLITSFEGSMLGPGAWRFIPRTGRETVTARAGRAYADVGRGELVAYVGSTGLIELAVREGSAADATGWRRGEVLRLERAPA
jgi:hypothetical protein